MTGDKNGLTSMHTTTWKCRKPSYNHVPAWIRWNFIFHWPCIIYINMYAPHLVPRPLPDFISQLWKKSYMVSDMRYTNNSWIKDTIADGQDVKTAVTKEVACRLHHTVAVFHMESNSHQSYSSHHQHEPIVTDTYVETIAISSGGMLHIQWLYCGLW